MSSSGQSPLSRLEAAAASVQSRVFLKGILDFYHRYTGWLAVVAFPLILALRLLFKFTRIEALLAGAVIVLIWIIAGVFVGLTKRPNFLSSLSIWDHVERKKDLFSSAWFFETQSQKEKRGLSEGEKLHVSRAMVSLDGVKERIPSLIRIPNLARAVAALAIMAIAAITILPRGNVDEGEQLLTEEMQAEAEKQSARLKELAEELEKMAEKGEIDRSELEKLRSDVEDAAGELAETDGLTANEILEGLEARARAAEKLAEKLGAADNSWASEEMLREMSQHADFADLAVTIKDKNADNASIESEKIAELLSVDDLKIESSDRITTALERTLEASTEDDKSKPVGERVGNASRKMADQQAKTAGREFEELAKYFRTVKQREEARKKLEELASKLRDAGSEISGSKLQKMQQLAGGDNGENGKNGEGNGPEGLQPIAQTPMPVPNQPMPQMPQAGPNGAPQIQPGGATQLPIPGMGQPAPSGNGEKGQEKGDQPGIAAPVPGQGNQDGKNQAGFAMSQDGKEGQKGQGQPSALMAPVPGQAPGGQPAPGGALGQAPGATPGGNSSQGQAGNGGLEAGEGTAAMGNTPTEATKAAQDARVATQIGKEGESTFRAIEGQNQTEKAQRESQKAVVNAIAVEEQALDDKSLPMSRKEHVLRYFSEIRRQFEETGTK